ncbi:hypothetical protein DOTSEDRAFT_72050 [Dothistroma septosporum NZE10]|uniref:Uncharacterized protein n=1 Tax=Dothistroma septosporum (strain NZE10 / CBS 128990) TaxID=675120 RepID=N1PPT6_DOTSN|nr:hypothetical protein DOTSEDRAFT_72050 [Dothistroma septosporum NZE10]
MKLPFAPDELQAAGQQENHIKRIVDHAAAGMLDITRTVVKRSETSSSSDPSSTCNDAGADCHTPAQTQNTQNTAIILGVVIPIVVAMVILIVLHRRHVKKQRIEDLNDPHKSLDFGMEGIAPTTSKQSKGRKKGPEMIVTDVGAASSKRKDMGLSLDMSMHIDSPYVLPAAMNGSRESIHSMSRSMKDPHDPYRPVTLMRPSTDNDSIRYNTRFNDNGSVYSMSTGHHSNLRDNVSLVANARPMSQSLDKRADSMSPHESMSPTDFPPRQMHGSMNRNGQNSRRPSLDKPMPEINEKEIDHLPPAMPEPVAKELPSPPRLPENINLAPPRKDSMTASPLDSRPESSNYGDDLPPAPTHPTIVIPEPYEIDVVAVRHSLDAPATLPARGASLHPAEPVPAQNRLSVMGLRPLPPDVPDETPELRANRIRSFYKEYFDDTKGPGGPPAIGVTADEVHDDYLDGVIYDPSSGGFYAPGARPFAEAPVRRAMTPPPRGAMGKPRVSGGSQGGYPHQRKFSAAYSTMSGGRPRGRSMPKKKLPPPSPLSSLPTPHKLKEDAQIFNPLDFAPPTSIRDLQNGRRPDSPLGTPRPYSPSVRAFTPLASSFDHLAVLPSPHDLRKSGTFTALDFAPPSKIRDPMLSPSDAGSIRSNRSGVSAMQRDAIREGAYRVSRIPKEMVTTRDDLSSQLRPKMDMTSYA